MPAGGERVKRFAVHQPELNVLIHPVVLAPMTLWPISPRIRLFCRRYDPRADRLQISVQIRLLDLGRLKRRVELLGAGDDRLIAARWAAPAVLHEQQDERRRQNASRQKLSGAHVGSSSKTRHIPGFFDAELKLMTRIDSGN